MRLTTRQAILEEIYPLYLTIAEFGSLHRLSGLQQRVANNPSHGLIAEIDGQAAGFKLGYQTRSATSYELAGRGLAGLSPPGRGSKPYW